MDSHDNEPAGHSPSRTAPGRDGRRLSGFLWMVTERSCSTHRPYPEDHQQDLQRQGAHYAANLAGLRTSAPATCALLAQLAARLRRGARSRQCRFYRKVAIEAFGNKCNRCGYEKFPICVVHHKDRNRFNNDISNLEVLCSRCHDEEHFLAKDGLWTENKGSGTA